MRITAYTAKLPMNSQPTDIGTIGINMFLNGECIELDLTLKNGMINK